MTTTTPVWRDPSPDQPPFNPWHMTTYRGFACEVTPATYRDGIIWYVGQTNDQGRSYAPCRDGLAPTVEDAKAAAIAYVDRFIDRLIAAGASGPFENHGGYLGDSWDLR